MATQRVFKNECSESDGLYSYISAKTDGRMFCSAEPIDRGDFWEVEVSPIGGALSQSDVTFPKDNNLSDADIQKQIDQFERPEFPSAGPAPHVSGWEYGVATDLGNPDAKPVSDEPKSEQEQHNDDLERLLERMKPYR